MKKVLLLLLLISSISFAQTKLLITEIVVQPTDGEYIEIHNPGITPVDLTNYYLTDATFSGGGAYYYNIVTGADYGGGGFSDWHAKFPAGAIIAPGEHQTVALNGDSLFAAIYGVQPTYELYEDGTNGTDVPDMLEAVTNSISQQGGMTNGDEVAVLYFWDGATDLVTDIDYVIYNSGSPTANNEAISKNGVSVDGPDADTLKTAYAAETLIADQVSAPTAPVDSSIQRVDYSEGTQAATNGNGIGGVDEMSENLDVTFISSAPTPNAPHSSVPVELTSFTASVSGNVVSLNWSTATETNNAGFEIQKSVDNSSFVKIGFVDGHGSTTEVKVYSFSDELNSSSKISYRLRQVDFDGSYEFSNVVEVEGQQIAKYSLEQNYPNPFNPSTIISFNLPTDSQVKLSVFNVLGETVSELLNEQLTSGTHKVNFNAANLNSGVYFYRLEAGNFLEIKKMMLLK